MPSIASPAPCPGLPSSAATQGVSNGIPLPAAFAPVATPSLNASKSSLEIDALGLGEANAASPLQKPSAQAASLNGIPSNGLPIISSSDRIQRTARMLRSDSRVNLLT